MTDEEGRTRQAHPDFILFFFFFIFLFFYLIFLYFILQGNPPTFTFSYSFFCRVRTVEGVVTDKESVLIWLYSLKIFLFQQINLFVYLFENISIPSNKFLISNNSKSRLSMCETVSKTAFQYNHLFWFQKPMKVKRVKWSRKKWNGHDLMHIYHKKCEIIQKI